MNFVRNDAYAKDPISEFIIVNPIIRGRHSHSQGLLYVFDGGCVGSFCTNGGGQLHTALFIVASDETI